MANHQSLAELFEDYRLRRLLGKSPETVKKYRIELRRFERQLGREPTTADLNDKTVARLLDYQLNVEHAAAGTVNKTRSCILALWRYACRRKLVAEWPELDRLDEPERQPQAWLESQVDALFAACRTEPGMIGEIPASLWWTALHLVQWDTAERIGAVLKLSFDDYDPHDRWLTIPYAVRKRKTRDKGHRLSEDTAVALECIRSPRKLIFPWPFTYTYLWDKYTKLLERAGLPTDRRSKFHRVRKSVASHYEAQGGDATKLLDHNSRKTTQTYLDPRIVPQQHASELLFRPGEPRDRRAS